MPPLERLPRAVLFDWDNTLVDTWPVIHEAMNATLAAMGHAQWTLAETHARVRRSMREAFPEMFGERWQEARDVFYGRFDEIHLERLAALCDAEALLAELFGRGIFLGVVSNKMGKNLRLEVGHLGWERYFSGLVGATDAARDKPAVEPVDLALSAGPHRRGPDVWFVGDTAIDIECARNSGCTGILIRPAPPDGGEFADCPPRAHFASCGALLDLVRIF